jgi:hypothetical protein
MRESLVMPFAMLRYLASRPGPTVLTDPDDIERAELLRSVELVEAHIPASITSKDGSVRYTGAAVIHSVIAAGRKLADQSPAFPDSSAGFGLRPILTANEPFQMEPVGMRFGSESRVR